MITFSLNGQVYSLEHSITLFEILYYFNYNDSLSVLEYNKLVSNKNEWKRTFLQDQDIIEIVTIVGGG